LNSNWRSKVAIKANIVIDQGTDFSSVIDVTDDQDRPFDLTDYVASSQMRKNYASSTAVTFNTSVNEASGQIYLELDKSTTSQLEPGRYLYDVEITAALGNGSTIRVVEGIVTVTPGMTRV